MLEAIVIGLGALLVIAVVLVVFGVIRKGTHAGPAAAATAFALPAGARIVEMQSEPGRLILRLRDADGAEEVDIVDTADGRLVTRIK
jgi:hypothetical protein